MSDTGEATKQASENDEENNNEESPSSVISGEKLREYKNAFAVFDTDGSNSISVEELKKVLESLGKNPTDEEVETMIAGVDDDGNGEIEFEEFIKLMEDEEKSFKTEDLMRQAFGVLDPDGEGYITVSRLKRVVGELGCDFSDEEIGEMMAEADPDGNGKVDYGGLIGLMSTENETLASAYKKREKIEEIKREEDARHEAERELEAEQTADTAEETVEEIERYGIPDMEEISSQFDNEQYDKYSRQIPPGGRVVKRPGKKIPISKTRMRYLQRKNKAISTEGSNGESIYGSQMSLSEQESTMSGHQPEFKTYFRPDTDNWLGTINDQSKPFDARFTSHQPRQYKHVGSRLLDPKYYLKKPRDSLDEQPRFESAKMCAVSIDFGEELKRLQKTKSKASKSTDTFKADSTSNLASARELPKPPTQSYAEKVRTEKPSKETKFYYALWRSAFTTAIERLRENKKARAIRLNTPELLKEQQLKEEIEKRRQSCRPRPKQPHRMSVISPTIQPTTQSRVKDTTQPENIKHNFSRGSYTERLKKINSLEQKLLQKQQEQKQKPNTTSQKTELAPLQKRGDVITRSGLNRMLKI